MGEGANNETPITLSSVCKMQMAFVLIIEVTSNNELALLESFESPIVCYLIIHHYISHIVRGISQ